jgi:hypothetical protein
VDKGDKIVKILLLLFFIINLQLFANNYDDFNKHLKAKNFALACKSGKKLVFGDHINDENQISKIALSCLNADYINILGSLQIKLRSSKKARANATILSSILLQKRLIYQAMFDDMDISSMFLPVIDHPLSHTFVALRDKSYKLLSTSPKVIVFDVGMKRYKVYIEKSKKARIVIEIKNEDDTIEEHKYR